MRESCDVAVVGGGPVGLYMGLALAGRGLSVKVLERSTHRHGESRAIGIHPPGLRCLEHVGLAQAAIARGIRVTHGRAFADGASLGSISFARLRPPYPFVLCVPQVEIEELLEARLELIAPTALVRDCHVSGVESGERGVQLELREGGSTQTLSARYVVACDGKRSVVRACAGIDFEGFAYPDSFMMGDFHDDTDLAEQAGIFLSRQGLVESFPLPGAKRRWVARMDGPEPPDVHALIERIAARTGNQVRASTCSMLSAFTAENFLASEFVRGRVLLAGDASHVLSPIGGQGMNLGWLDASHLAAILPRCLVASDAAALLARYGQRRRRAARAATRRAELFMGMGRPAKHPRLRNVLVRGLLTAPMAGLSARLFTMAAERLAS